MNICDECLICPNPDTHCEHVPVLTIYFDDDNKILTLDMEIVEDQIKEVLDRYAGIYSGRIEDSITGNTTTFGG
jgi:hypothetical protein